jgi:uncharacterized protein
MIVDLAKLGNSSVPFDFTIQPDEIDLEGENISLKSAVKVAGDLRKGIVQTDVKGKISARISLECTRCLTEIEQDFDVSFEAAFVGAEHYTAAKEAELKGEDLDVSLLESDEVDLTELAREQILLNLPEQVFCSEDCKGLCEKCGANRNLINCNCEEKEIDPRWSALKNLK